MNENKRLIIGILECGKFSEEMTNDFGSYSTLYSKLLGTDVFDYRSFAVHDGDSPTINDADAWLISGSRHGAYEEHNWIPPLEAHLRAAYSAKQPIVGVCFGHQILAKAMGGRVVKFDGGWEIGQRHYSLKGPFAESSANQANLIAFHQDQVVEVPPNATVIGETEHCQYAALQYGNRAISIQPHPEFDDVFVTALLDERQHLFPREKVTDARSSLGNDLDNPDVGSVLRKFILQGLR